MTAWPFPADTVLDRARRVAQIYRHALQQLDPEQCRALDAQMATLGQTWVAPTPSTHEPDDLLTTDLAADEMNVSRRTIYTWRDNGLPVIETADGPRYRVGDLHAHLAEKRRRRSRRA